MLLCTGLALLVWQHHGVHAAPAIACASAAHTSLFHLTGVSQPSCLSTEMGVLWSQILVEFTGNKSSSCTYTLKGSAAQLEGGAGGLSSSTYMYNTSMAVKYATASGSQTWQSTE